MKLNVVLRTDTGDRLDILFEANPELAKLWADDLLTADSDFASGHIETDQGTELFSRPVEGFWRASTRQ